MENKTKLTLFSRGDKYMVHTSTDNSWTLYQPKQYVDSFLKDNPEVYEVEYASDGGSF